MPPSQLFGGTLWRKKKRKEKFTGILQNKCMFFAEFKNMGGGTPMWGHSQNLVRLRKKSWLHYWALDRFPVLFQWGRSHRDVTSGHKIEKTDIHVISPGGLNRCRKFQNDPLRTVTFTELQIWSEVTSSDLAWWPDLVWLGVKNFKGRCKIDAVRDRHLKRVAALARFSVILKNIRGALIPPNR